MPSQFTIDTLVNTTASATQPTIASNAPQESSKPAIIASRGRCEADGVGLSHYILMDRKVPE